DADDLRGEVTELRRKLLEAEAEAAEIQAEQGLLDEAPRLAGAAVRTLSAEEKFWGKALPCAVSKGAAGQAAVPPKISEVREGIDQKTAIAAWKTALNRNMEFQAEIAKAKELFGGPAGEAGAAGGLSAGLIGLGALTVLGGVILAAHEVRDRLRWRLR